jgi:hypothetical protein
MNPSVGTEYLTVETVATGFGLLATEIPVTISDFNTFIELLAVALISTFLLSPFLISPITSPVNASTNE